MSKASRLRDILDFLFSRADIEVFGMFGPGNLGDEAMRIAALETLPGRTIGSVSYPESPLLRSAMHRRTRKDIMVAGGTLIHGGAADGTNHWLSYVEHRVANGARLSCFGTGIAFLPEQVESRSDIWMRWAALLKQADRVALRGPMSCASALKMGVNAEVFGDFAFLFHDSSRLVSRSARERRIGLNVGECLADQQAHEAVWTALVRHLAPRYAIEFFVVTPGDMAATRRVIRASGLELAAVVVRPFYHDVPGFLQATAAVTLFVGLKLHGAGLALISGAPALLFSYEEKCRDFMQAIDAEACLLTLEMCPEDVLARVDAALNDPDQVTFSDVIGDFASRQRQTLKSRYGA